MVSGGVYAVREVELYLIMNDEKKTLPLMVKPKCPDCEFCQVCNERRCAMCRPSPKSKKKKKTDNGEPIPR